MWYDELLSKIFREDTLVKRKLVSLRGMGKLLVSEKELEQFAGQARESLLKGVTRIRET